MSFEKEMHIPTGAGEDTVQDPQGPYDASLRLYNCLLLEYEVNWRVNVCLPPADVS